MKGFAKKMHECLRRIGEKELQAHMSDRTEPMLYRALASSSLFTYHLHEYTANRAMNRTNINMTFLMTCLDRVITVERNKHDEWEIENRLQKSLSAAFNPLNATPVKGKGKGKQDTKGKGARFSWKGKDGNKGKGKGKGKK